MVEYNCPCQYISHSLIMFKIQENSFEQRLWKSKTKQNRSNRQRFSHTTTIPTARNHYYYFFWCV